MAHVCRGRERNKKGEEREFERGERGIVCLVASLQGMSPRLNRCTYHYLYPVHGDNDIRVREKKGAIVHRSCEPISVACRLRANSLILYCTQAS